MRLSVTTGICDSNVMSVPIFSGSFEERDNLRHSHLVHGGKDAEVQKSRIFSGSYEERDNLRHSHLGYPGGYRESLVKTAHYV